MIRVTIRNSGLFLAIFAGAQALSAQPNIKSVQNAASNIIPGLPNAAIAQGSIFIVQGTGLGPANISVAPAAFRNTSLSNTSVTAMLGGAIVNALMYYTSAGQVAALLPSNTPTGTGALTVTYNGQTSAAAPITVTASNLGIFTVDSSGQGPGIVTYPDYSLVSTDKAANCGGPSTTCGAANPGDTLILWATGLGPVSGDDASGAGLGQAMNIPLTVWLGDVAVPVIYKGRSGCCIGEDQIVFTVPNNVPTGCAVPLAVQMNNTVSNHTVIPVAAGSRSCTPVNPALAAANAGKAIAAGPVAYASITLGKGLNNAGAALEDDAQFQLLKIAGYNPGTQPFFLSWVDDQPLGTCLVFNNQGGFNAPISSLVPLDAGSSFTVSGPGGTVPVKAGSGSFRSTLSTAATFLNPGSAYTVTGTGGADIGPFSATITYPANPTLTSPAGSITITRANGLTVAWSGASANEYIQLLVSSATDSSYANYAQAQCNALASAGTFTIPPYVLQALPAGNFSGFFFTPVTPEVPFTAKGIAAGILSTQSAGIAYNGGTTGSITLK